MLKKVLILSIFSLKLFSIDYIFSLEDEGSVQIEIDNNLYEKKTTYKQYNIKELFDNISIKKPNHTINNNPFLNSVVNLINYSNKYSNTKIRKNNLKKLSKEELTNIIFKISEEFLNGPLDRITLKQKLLDNGIKWNFPSKKKINKDEILKAIELNTIENYVLDLLPKTNNYIGLKEKIDKLYFERNNLKKWHYKITKKISFGDFDQSVVVLRHYLYYLGDINYDDNSDYFDDTLEHGLKSFQTRFGLDPTGILNRSTINVLKMDVDIMIKRIKVAMDIEKYKYKKDGDFFLINIPEYRMHFYKDNIEELSMKTIVGSTKHKTPIFKSYLKYMVINPTWTIPDSIFKKEYIPELKKNLSFLDRGNMGVYKKGTDKELERWELEIIDWDKYSYESYIPYKIVQKPGSRNALGLVKFIFPNQYSVYMHDTPTKKLFRKRTRAFSHGCIRLEKPFDLYNNLKRNFLDNDIFIKKTDLNKYINLNKKIPVFIEYAPVFIKNGILHLRQDIYKIESIFML
jgi:murein L,D-transpeptidase YcbB/YkuD